MCTQESGSLGAKGPVATQANSEHSQGGKRRCTNDNANENDAATAKTAISNISMSVMNGILHGVVWVVVALQLPFILNHNEATEIYRPAYYKYTTELSLFDNTIWSYGTDYVLCIIMTSLACWILSFSHNRGTGGNGNDVKRLCYLSASMLLLYAISVLVGGIAHQNFHTVESRNTVLFRIIWTTCAGTVSLAPASMGMIGSECIRLFKNRKDCPSILKSMPLISDTYWIIYGLVVTIACGLGAMSFQRPACDLYIGGATQTPSTFYCMGFLYTMKHYNSKSTSKTSNSKKIQIHPHMRIMGLIGFILNAALLPIYPVLVLHLGWTLASVNTFLHSWLCMTWPMQGLILQHVIRALVVEEENNNNIEILEEQQQQKPLKMKKVQ